MRHPSVKDRAAKPDLAVYCAPANPNSLGVNLLFLVRRVPRQESPAWNFGSQYGNEA